MLECFHEMFRRFSDSAAFPIICVFVLKDVLVLQLLDYFITFARILLISVCVLNAQHCRYEKVLQVLNELEGYSCINEATDAVNVLGRIITFINIL